MSKLFTLVGIAAILPATACLNLYWAETALDISPIVARPAAAVLDAEGNAGDLLNTTLEPGAGLSETLRRPLFHQSRRPFVPTPVLSPPGVVEEISEPQAVEEQNRTSPELRLAGISISANGTRALLGPANGAEMRWYSQGDDIEGWNIAEINHAAVTLADRGATFIVSLYPPAAAGGGN